MKKFLFICRDYSLPLIAGVIVALIVANLFPETYHHIVHTPIIGEEINLHWLVNDVFMVFFFGIAGVEIVTSLEPGGALNPPKKAISPLMATVGGVIGPIIIYFILNALIGGPEYANGWGICIATDIALSWLIADLIFGEGHPAIKFLLLLAVVDDAIGLVIIAVFYPSPDKPFLPLWLLLWHLSSILLSERKNPTNLLHNSKNFKTAVSNYSSFLYAKRVPIVGTLYYFILFYVFYCYRFDDYVL